MGCCCHDESCDEVKKILEELNDKWKSIESLVKNQMN